MDIQAILIGVASLLFAGNIYFIKRLVDKVDKNNSSNERMEISMKHFHTQLSDIKQDIKDLRKIELDVAVLKSKLRGDEL